MAACRRWCQGTVIVTAAEVGSHRCHCGHGQGLAEWVLGVSHGPAGRALTPALCVQVDVASGVRRVMSSGGVR